MRALGSCWCLALAVGLGLACDDDDEAIAPETEVLTVTFAGTAVAAPGGRCPVLTVTINFPGEADPGGAFTVNQSQCLDPANPGVITDGEFTWSFPNGDAISGTYQGVNTPSGDPAVLNFDEDFTIESGEGEFEGASGKGKAIGTFNVQTRAAAVTVVVAFTH
jgi:hypothetical protein